MRVFSLRSDRNRPLMTSKLLVASSILTTTISAWSLRLLKDSAFISALRLPQRPIIHGGDVGAHHPPAECREAHPGLALPADEVAAAHLELEIDRGEVAAERQELEPDAALLDA